MKHILKLTFGLLLSVSAAFAHSDAFKPGFVDTLIEPYLQIQTGLAGDDLGAAREAANRFLGAMKEAPIEGAAAKEGAALADPAQAIAKAADIQSARSAFLPLSNEMIALVEHVGTTVDNNLFIAHCPMAFGNEGADWIQADKTVANPYYGSMMLRCGGIKTQLNGPSEETHEGHGGHGMMNKPTTSLSQSKLDALHAGVPGYETSKITKATSAGMGCCGK